ncbi:18159_t:CDS:2, partial [Gigaspora margarita]
MQDYKLGYQNFCYASQALADLWRKDLIYKKLVFAEYINKQTNSFSNILSSINKNKLENKKYKKNSKNNNENNDNLFTEEATILLSTSNRFLPPLIKGKDDYYVNAIHTL